MKSFLVTCLKLLGVIVLIIFVIAAYNFIVLGQKDFGFLKVYYYCRDGFYKTYPIGATDVAETYYDKNGSVIGQCRSWVPGDTCARAKELAGICSKRGVSLGNLLIW